MTLKRCGGAVHSYKKLGGIVVETAFIVDLTDVGGKKKLTDNGYKVFALTEFGGE